MQILKAIEMFSGTLPSGETVTLHTGNERVFGDADARWLLNEYPERFEWVVTAPPAETDEVEMTAALSADKPKQRKKS